MAKNVPVSTRVWDYSVDVINFNVFIIFGNPLMMGVFNFIWPRLTHLWAKNKTYFGEGIYRFYRSLALKMPFRWAKWWIEPNDATRLQEYSVKRQVEYFNKVSPTAKAFDSLIAEANIRIIKQLPKKDLWGLLPDVRFCGNVMTYLRANGRYDILNEYIRHGALSFATLEEFIASTAESAFQHHIGDLEQKVDFLAQYALRYGLIEQLRADIRKSLPEKCVARLERANRSYEQCRKVRCFCGLVNEQEEAKWREYCTENTFEPEAIAIMNEKQRKIFKTIKKN